MGASQIGRLLLGLGLFVGLVAGIGLVFGFQPAELPPAVVNIAVYKLTFLAAGGLLAVGAMLRRYAHREAERDRATTIGNTTPAEIAPGPFPLPPSQSLSQRESVRRSPNNDP